MDVTNARGWSCELNVKLDQFEKCRMCGPAWNSRRGRRLSSGGCSGQQRWSQWRPIYYSDWAAAAAAAMKRKTGRAIHTQDRTEGRQKVQKRNYGSKLNEWSTRRARKKEIIKNGGKRREKEKPSDAGQSMNREDQLPVRCSTSDRVERS